MDFLMVSGQIIFDTAIFSWSGEEVINKMNAFMDLMEKSLGAEKGSFSFMTEILVGVQTAGGVSNE